MRKRKWGGFNCWKVSDQVEAQARTSIFDSRLKGRQAFYRSNSLQCRACPPKAQKYQSAAIRTECVERRQCLRGRLMAE